MNRINTVESRVLQILRNSPETRYEDKFNEKLGVTKAQEQAMLAGSMIRWDSIAAKPKSYDENGKAIKPKDYER